jgi:hypothetical protein
VEDVERVQGGVQVSTLIRPQTFVIGLPVVVTVHHDGSVTAEVDFSELTAAMQEDGAIPDVFPEEGAEAPHVEPTPEVLAAAEAWVDGTTTFVVAWGKDRVPADAERCPCGAPIEGWRTGLPDGDSESHGHCLNAACALSTY